MKILNLKFFIVLCLLLFSITGQATIRVVAAENFYGNVAQAIGGSYVQVDTIINSPNQDPHLFSLSPFVLKTLQGADIIIYNGANYDPWIEPLLSEQHAEVINVASLLHVKQGSNPHIWYRPETMPIVAEKLTRLYGILDPVHKTDFIHQFNQFVLTYQNLYNLVRVLQAKFRDVPIIATEPVFNEMAKSLGFEMHGLDFQQSVMNDIPPSISQVKIFEDDLKHHSVQLLIYNKQVDSRTTKQMLSLAEQYNIPVVGVFETLPPNKTYVEWMIDQLREIEQVLQKNNKEPKQI